MVRLYGIIINIHQASSYNLYMYGIFDIFIIKKHSC